MARQVWGTFSVNDHCRPRAFVADVMIYDRLVIPVPPDDEERARWERQGWDPSKLERLLAILGDRAQALNWDDSRKQQWKTKYDAGSQIAYETGDWAFEATRTLLTENLPRHVTGIQAVTAFASVEELERELKVKRAAAPIGIPGAAAAAIVAREYLIPDDPAHTDEDLLKTAVDLSSDPSYRRKRAGYWRWAREFLDDRGLTDQVAIRDAVDEMRDLLEDEQKVIRRAKVRTGVRFAFLMGSVTLGMLGGPLTAVGVGGAFVSVGEFIAERFLDDRHESSRSVALVHDARKHFGWS